MSVRFHRQARAKSGRMQEAIAFAKEVSEYLNTNYKEVSIQAYVEAFGAGNTIHWYADYKDLATVETVNNRLNQDQKYGDLLTKSVDIFVDGSINDMIVMGL